jgi:hypothetical protein
MIAWLRREQQVHRVAGSSSRDSLDRAFGGGMAVMQTESSRSSSRPPYDCAYRSRTASSAGANSRAPSRPVRIVRRGIPHGDDVGASCLLIHLPTLEHEAVDCGVERRETLMKLGVRWSESLE